MRIRKFESLGLNQILMDLKLSECLWIHPRPNGSRQVSERAKAHLDSFVAWLFGDLVIPLVRSFFHVTDTAEHKNRLFYFRHCVWKSITAPFLHGLKRKMFREEASMGTATDAWNRLGTANLRLVPKGFGFRPLMNLRRKIGRASAGRKLAGSQAASINGLLKNVHEVLTHISHARPELLGSSLLGLDEIAKRIAEFKSRHIVGRRPLFFVKLDVQSCYDSIPHGKLSDIVTGKVLQKENYHVQKYDVLKSIHGRTKKIFKKYATPTSDFVGLTKFALASLKGRPATARVLVDKVVGHAIDRHEISRSLLEHICGNTVAISGKCHRQTVGIPQGSILSSLLCSLFYGDMDRECLGKFLDSPESLLMRFIDDMLFVTTSYQQANEFIQAIYPGFTEYGVQINLAKSATNFYHPLVRQKVAAAAQFPWCGLLIDQDSFAVYGDYGRFIGTYIADSLSVERCLKPAEAFARMLKIFLKPKLKHVFVSSGVNDSEAVALNVFQNFVYTAIKAHAYLKELRRDHGIVIRAPVLIRALREAVGFAVGMVGRIDPGSTVPVCWLGLTAVRTVLEGRPHHYRGPVLDALAELCAAARPPHTQGCDYGRVLASGQALLGGILH